MDMMLKKTNGKRHYGQRRCHGKIRLTLHGHETKNADCEEFPSQSALLYVLIPTI